MGNAVAGPEIANRVVHTSLFFVAERFLHVGGGADRVEDRVATAAQGFEAGLGCLDFVFGQLVD